MYVTFDQVILVANKEKLKPDDPIIYERDYQGQRVLTLDGSPNKYAGQATPYGHMYVDTSDQICVVPLKWSWDDAALSWEYIPPEDPLEGVL